MLSPLEFLFRWAEPGDLIVWCTYRAPAATTGRATMAWGGSSLGPRRKYTVCRRHFRTLLHLCEIRQDHDLSDDFEGELINDFMRLGALEIERVMPRTDRYASACKTCHKERGRPWARPKKVMRSYR